GTIEVSGVLTTFTNSGTIRGTEISGGGNIQELTNSGSMDFKASNIQVGKLSNTAGIFTLSGASTLNIQDAFDNAEGAQLTTNSANKETIDLGNARLAKAVVSKTTFNNEGIIAGNTKLEITTKNGWAKTFTNSGLIEKVTLTSGSSTNGIVTFTNSGTIDNATITTNFVNFNNTEKGSIELGESSVINLLGAVDKTASFNNAGTIALNGSAIKVSEGTKATIINTGTIDLGIKAGTGAHFDVTDAKTQDAIVVKEWHLSNLTSADVYNNKSTSDGTDKIIVKGFNNGVNQSLRFENASIVIDPTKNPNMAIGEAFRLDQIVVDESGAAVQELKGDVYDKVAAAQKAGTTDPRLVTINSVTSTDPVFVVTGVDAYSGKENKKVGEEEGEGKVVAGDGIIDSFQIGVNAANGAGAVATQGAVSANITRSAFVGSVVGNAVNTALATLGGARVSYNDEDVDFSKLEKYAQVGSDVTDRTYAKDSTIFIMPYYRSSSVDLPTNQSLDGDTYGLIGGVQKGLGNAGILGFFLGYERTSASATNLDQDDNTFFAGVNYYKTLGGTSTYDYYAKGMLRFSSTSSDITQKMINGDTKRSPDSTSYGVEAGVGVNFYQDIHTITPEVGLSFDRVSVDGLNSAGVQSFDNDINLIVGKVGLNWLAQFTDTVSTNFGVGIRYNFKDSFDARVKINETTYNTKSELDSFYYYLNAGVNFALTPNWELSFLYNGDFSSNTASHSGFVKLGYWW
ncbi:autotransporter outer membrane beta-barrel domain-containing protein, partial [Helicobacter sp.]|uniref:autotransporter outer membrane beta-barrel domain-containing protein n=1 Tax=Helicobacter sp. TaxID=218 RepID=UPI002A7614C6